METRSLKNVGWALIVVGLADIGFMAYCIANEQAYSSSFNIFAVIAGILLVRGSQRTGYYVAWFATFMFTGFVGLLVLLPAFTPYSLLRTKLLLDPGSFLISTVVAFAAIAFLFWVYRTLTSPAIVSARVSNGIKAKPGHWPFIVGGLLVGGLAIAVTIAKNGETGERAVRLAQEKVQGDYQYHVSSMHWSGNHGRAGVLAYNDREIKEVTVEW